VPGASARQIKSEVGLDLAHYVANLTKGKLSVRRARTLVEDGCCRINGQVESFGSYKLEKGDIVEVILPDEDTEHHYDVERLVWADADFIAYDKPAFLPVTPLDKAKSWSLLDILKGSLGDLIPVHRLDADTSGIVLFARKAQVARKLEEAFASHQVAKTYHAVVRGHPRETGTYRSYLVKIGEGKGFEQWRSGRGADAREAVTTWAVERRVGPYASLVRVEPKTGRYHQIRIHFREMGSPLYGDRTYGDRRDPVHVHRHLLHSSELKLAHPMSGDPVHIKAPMPRDMVDAIAQLDKL
jgi:RluA family pseudouridine synthase